MREKEMSLTKSQFSAAEIDQAGRVLARSSANDKDSTEWSEAVRLINQWRASHAHLVFTPKAGPGGVLVLWDDYTCERRIIP